MVLPSTPVTVMTGSKLLVGLITTSQCAVLPTRSSLHVTDCGSSPALASRLAMSVCRASLPTACLPSTPTLASQPETSAPRVAKAPTAVVTVCKGRLLDHCWHVATRAFCTDHSKLAADVMVNCR